MKKIIMVVGCQRSGTNTLFRSLAADRQIKSFNENAKSTVFESFLLRPEPEIRPILQSIEGAILLKPISETKERSLNDVLDEYGNYSLWIVNIYRDPVDVFCSTILTWPGTYDADKFILEWNDRNKRALSISPKHKAQFANVKYEDLITDPKVFFDLCRFLRVNGKYLFRRNSGNGRRLLRWKIKAKIDHGTSDVLKELEENRTFKSKMPNNKITKGLLRIYWKMHSRAYLRAHLPTPENRSTACRIVLSDV